MILPAVLCYSAAMTLTSTHDGFESSGLCYDMASARVYLSFMHTSTSAFPLIQTCVLLLSAIVLFGRLTTAYRAAYSQTYGSIRDKVIPSGTPASRGNDFDTALLGWGVLLSWKNGLQSC